MGFFFPVYEKNSLPAKWSDRYTTRGYMVADPVLHWCYQNSGVSRWSALGVADPRGVLKDAESHGLAFGVAASCTDPGDASQRSFGSFCRADREFTDAELVEIYDLLEDIHIEMVPPKNLTDAELEALRMVKNGLLMKEIANLLGVSEGAVKQRLKNAKAKLRAKTSTQAATMATSFGLI
jgi:LuxR family transcriptional regulator